MPQNTKEIGGYFSFELTLQTTKSFFNNGVIALNTARNCLRYVIRAYNIKEIYLPFYTCPVVWQSVQKENCKIKFYHIDENFYPVQNFPENAYILYTNYFGVNSKNVKKLSLIYKNLIVDNSQAFYMPKYGIASFNSVRKFFGVPDGAFLSCDKKIDFKLKQNISYQRCSHLLKRLDVNAKYGYADFCQNDNSLINEDIEYMSNLTKHIISTINFETAKAKRLCNFNHLLSTLQKSNQINLNLDFDDVPLVYPYLCFKPALKQKLIENNIFVATYWNSLPDEYIEGKFQKYLVPLPIDQRYSTKDMDIILEVINNELER